MRWRVTIIGVGKKKTAKKTKAAKSSVSNEDRYRMIQEAAYYIAEKDSFSGDACAYWAEAEKQINAQLR